MHAVYPSPKLVTAKVNTLIEFLRAAFAREDWPSILAQPDQEPVAESKPKLRRRA
jgi:hypothetical protein